MPGVKGIPKSGRPRGPQNSSPASRNFGPNRSLRSFFHTSAERMASTATGGRRTVLRPRTVFGRP